MRQISQKRAIEIIMERKHVPLAVAERLYFQNKETYRLGDSIPEKHLDAICSGEPFISNLKDVR